MPVTGSKPGPEKGPGGGGRTTFRPPWVKEGTQSTSTTTTPNKAPWMKKTTTPAANTTTPTTTTKPDTTTKTIAKPAPKPENGQPVKEAKLQSREIKVPIMTTKPKPVQPPLSKPAPVEKKEPKKDEKKEEIKKKEEPKKKIVPPPKKQESSEEEEEEETDEETEEETEEEETDEEEEDEIESPPSPKPAKKNFLIEKPQLRHVDKNLRKSPSLAQARKQESKDAGAEEEILTRKKNFLLEKPKLRHVEKTPSIDLIKKSTTNELPEQPKLKPVLKKEPKIEEKETPEFITRKQSLTAEKKNVPAPPPPPPNMSNAPPPPPPPALRPPEGFQKKPMSSKHKQVIDKLKQRPRRRPDWSEMMKEVEDGKKLRHVECNDRSKPILTTKSMTKVSGQFVYETEKANCHNALLKQIQGGIRLRSVKTNDRSKPVLEGLRKFRRQMTIEEQIQKSESRAAIAMNEQPPEVQESEDEMDDIDKLRDDLQSTKQMLALELRNKEAQERENKRLLSKIANLEAELEREKSKGSSGDASTTGMEAMKTTSTTSGTSTAADEALVNSLKKDAEEARKTCKDLENKYQHAAEELDSAKNEMEEHKRKIAALEKQLAQGSVDSRRPSEAAQKDSSPEPEAEFSESDSDEDEEKKAERAARRLTREVKMLRTKLLKFKDKQQAAKRERSNLKEAMKKNQVLFKDETKKLKKLQKEVDKMAKMLKDVGDEDDEDGEEKENEEEAEEEEEETEEEEESESEESEGSGSETESESEAEDAADSDKKKNLEPRVKKYEGRLNALKKGNYLLQANVDRILDEINKTREQSQQLQRDLDSVLSELG